ncbi:MAG: DUF1080 domain-containing protein [Verrucomicrobiales bacterium]
MNRIFLLPVVAATALLASCSSETKPPAPETTAPRKVPVAIALFNGKDFDGWSHVLVGDVAMQDVWSVSDGVIVCKGEPLGFLHTKESYQDYTLTFEWRWAPGREPGNSGVLLRIASKAETFMPKCVEAQLKHGSAGDIWAFYGAGIKSEGERAREVKANPNLGDFKGVAKIKDAEKPPGEWNRCEITVSGDTLTLKINGELVNEASGLDIVSGPIGFQSEGAEIHFRNIALQKL